MQPFLIIRYYNHFHHQATRAAAEMEAAAATAVNKICYLFL
jgi:hypothetical protein